MSALIKIGNTTIIIYKYIKKVKNNNLQSERIGDSERYLHWFESSPIAWFHPRRVRVWFVLSLSPFLALSPNDNDIRFLYGLISATDCRGCRPFLNIRNFRSTSVFSFPLFTFLLYLVTFVFFQKSLNSNVDDLSSASSSLISFGQNYLNLSFLDVCRNIRFSFFCFFR